MTVPLSACKYVIQVAITCDALIVGQCALILFIVSGTRLTLRVENPCLVHALVVVLCESARSNFATFFPVHSVYACYMKYICSLIEI